MIEYRYDTQLLIEGEDLDEDVINDYFLDNFKGDCLLVAGDEELIKMAYNYITEETSWNPEYYEVEFSADTFRIWLYDIISDEESSHGVTRGKFEINRKTGLGEDSITFEKIDFSKYK